MNDTLSIKAYLPATIDAAELDSTTRTFPRIASASINDTRRQSLHVSSLSPTVLRIAHTPRTAKNLVQKSLFSVDQTLTRLDASSNPIGTTKFKVGFITEIPADVTLAEWQAAKNLLIGALIESSGALADAIYNGEQ